jgi:hypothetical protein
MKLIKNIFFHCIIVFLITLAIYGGFTLFKEIYNLTILNLEKIFLIIMLSIYTFFGLLGCYYWICFHEIIEDKKGILNSKILYSLIFISVISVFFLRFYYNNEITKDWLLQIGEIIAIAWITYVPIHKENSTYKKKRQI